MGKKLILLIAVVAVMSATAFGQKASAVKKVAYFVTDPAVNYRDAQGRLHLQFIIDEVQTIQMAEQLKTLFLRYGISESVTIEPTSTPGSWQVYEISKPGIKMNMHRKLFVIMGIQFVNVDGEVYEVESFRMKMLNKN